MLEIGNKYHITTEKLYLHSTSLMGICQTEFSEPNEYGIEPYYIFTIIEVDGDKLLNTVPQIIYKKDIKDYQEIK